ncbi:MAG: hypothetical protein SW833_19580 [Cyanobacteriota bacterium]|nr:hypothetical protein [Cyanobacteriota bacterium]
MLERLILAVAVTLSLCIFSQVGDRPTSLAGRDGEFRPSYPSLIAKRLMLER